MKLNFQSSVTVTPAWRDNDKLPAAEQFTITARTLTNDHLFEVMDVVAPLMNDAGKVDMGKVEMKEVRILLIGLGKILPPYITVNNLEDSLGAVTPERIFTDPRFINLAVELIGAVINASSPSDSDEKN